MSEYEEILRDTREFGSFQRRVFFLVSLLDIPSAWSMLLPVLIGANPGWKCPVKDSVWNFTDNERYQSNYTNFTEGACSADGLKCDGLLFGKDLTSILTEFGLICDQNYVADLILTIQMAGVVIGAALTGQLADTFGRRPVLYLEHLALCILWLGTAFVGSWQAYAALRFIIGGLTGGIILVTFVLPIEFMTPKWRSFCGCIGFWVVGMATLAFLGYFIRDWRHLLIGTSVISASFLITFWFVPESPRWLLQQHRYEEAEKILTAMAKSNNKPVPDFSPLKIFVEKEEQKRKEMLKYSYCHLFATRRLVKCTIVLSWCWFCCGAIYYGVQLNVKNLSGDRYINLLVSGLVEWPSFILVLFSTNFIGRRKTFLLLIMIAGSSMFSVFIMSLVGKMKELPGVVRALAMIGKAGIAGGWAAIMIYSGESFPTVIRNIGVGAVSTASRIGGVVAPQIVYLSNISKPLPYAVIGCMAFSCGLLILVLPETKDIPLSDKLFDEISTTDGSSNPLDNSLDEKIDIEKENWDKENPPQV